MTDSVQFDIFEARRLRDEGMKRVSENSATWHELAFQTACKLPQEWSGLGEDVRAYVSEIVGEPHHPNCWGALTNSLQRSGVLEKTGEWRGARSKKSHASTYPVLRRGRRQ